MHCPDSDHRVSSLKVVDSVVILVDLQHFLKTVQSQVELSLTPVDFTQVVQRFAGLKLVLSEVLLRYLQTLLHVLHCELVVFLMHIDHSDVDYLIDAMH